MKHYHKGFVCGFFDILHGGHIDILSQAKEMCDYLIVGVGTDEFMLKRKHRLSVLPYEERVTIIKSLRCVDEVVPEEDLDKITAYEKYRFDVMFAGEDHENEPTYKAAESKLKELNVDVIYIPRKNSTSSTKLRKRIVEVNASESYIE